MCGLVINPCLFVVFITTQSHTQSIGLTCFALCNDKVASVKWQSAGHSVWRQRTAAAARRVHRRAQKPRCPVIFHNIYFSVSRCYSKSRGFTVIHVTLNLLNYFLAAFPTLFYPYYLKVGHMHNLCNVLARAVVISVTPTDTKINTAVTNNPLLLLYYMTTMERWAKVHHSLYWVLTSFKMMVVIVEITFYWRSYSYITELTVRFPQVTHSFVRSFCDNWASLSRRFTEL